MSLTISVEGDVRAILADLERVEKRHVRLATLRALNRTLAWVRTRAKREIAAQVGVPVTLANRRLYQRKATPAIQSVMIGLVLRPIPAVFLPHHQTRTGVKAGRHSFRSAFIASDPDGREMIFRRLSTKAHPIDAVKIPVAATGQAILESLTRDKARARFKELFEKDLAWRLSRGA